MKLIFLTVAMMLMVSPAWATQGLEHSSRTITVQGQGMASGSPDLAVIRSGVVSQAVSPSDAITTNNEAVSQLLSIARQFGIDDKDMQTSQFSLRPQYKRNNKQTPPQISGYAVSNEFTIRLRDVSKLGQFLDQLVRGGANQISGIAFEIEDMGALNDKARQQAVADAKARAEIYAKEFGVTVGDTISIVETSTSSRPSPGLRTMSMQMAAQVPVAAGERVVSASITVIFSIE